MATAKRIEACKPDIELRISWDEAIALRSICGLVCGDTAYSNRKYTNPIEQALRDVGVPADGITDTALFTGCLYAKS